MVGGVVDFTLMVGRSFICKLTEQDSWGNTYKLEGIDPNTGMCLLTRGQGKTQQRYWQHLSQLPPLMEA